MPKKSSIKKSIAKIIKSMPDHLPGKDPMGVIENTSISQLSQEERPEEPPVKILNIKTRGFEMDDNLVLLWTKDGETLNIELVHADTEEIQKELKDNIINQQPESLFDGKTITMMTTFKSRI